ncbi:unnamed protein product [Cylindrotheca closterium]|uniref:Uncharacterized protein n=1 Tax=Cylindrotheca closterium TaxID=2856 RepID=A0AAD2CTD4_9STRA|nr:unnamed protein product [Cylindrotheca closterium]
MSQSYYRTRSHSTNPRDGLTTIKETDTVSGQSVDLDAMSVATPFMALEDKRYFKRSNLDPTEIIGVDVRKGKHERNQADLIGNIWRFLVCCVIKIRMDPINRLRFTRGLQVFLPLLSPYESYLLGELIEDLDFSQKGSWDVLARCFANRNVSRILVQMFASKFDIFWHLSTQIKYSRTFDFLGKLPLLGFFAFPATENFPSSKAFSFNAIIRSIKPGAWLIRFATSNLEGSIAVDPKAPAQNLAAEVTGFELANRNSKGTFFGRSETNKHRLEHRLPTDESIVRSFNTSPASTIVNNGVEHVLRCLVKHWEGMLAEENGNFAHQRMELLNPFETLRIHLPVVLTVLMNLRGRNVFDSAEVARYMRAMQEFRSDNISVRQDIEQGRRSIQQIRIACSYVKSQILDGLLSPKQPENGKETISPIIDNVCAGIASRSQPLAKWIRSIRKSIQQLEREANQLFPLLEDVQDGITIGYKLLEGVDWITPKDSALKSEIIGHIKDEEKWNRSVELALDKLAAKEKRTLMECIQKGQRRLPAFENLLDRVVSLIKREKRRENIDRRLQELSKGPEVSDLQKHHWYWVTIKGVDRAFCLESSSRSLLIVRDVETGCLEEVDQSRRGVRIRKYHPVAAAIARAQRMFMTIEMDRLKIFSYEAFMEFGCPSHVSGDISLRTSLLQLLMVSQMHSYHINDARRNILSEVKLSGERKRRTEKPQNVLIVGGGPSGMMCAIHTVHNVLLSGGQLSVHQSRNAFQEGASSFERSQIVRLDARIISMLRYHLGSIFEDTFLPLEGETNAYLGNTLPTQGFVEINIKRLEDILERELVSLASRDLLLYYHNSEIIVDPETLKLKKKGKHLKIDEVVVGADGKKLCVSKFDYKEKLVKPSELKAGTAYRIGIDGDSQLLPYRLSHKDAYGWFHFNNLSLQCKPFSVRETELPAIYESFKGEASPTEVELIEFGSGTAALDSQTQSSVNFTELRDQEFEIDVSDCHVVLSSGKPRAPRQNQKNKVKKDYKKHHFECTTAEPHIVCCIEGAKVALGMHKAGNKRFGSGWWDDLRSFSEDNTRLIGDFTKSLRVVSILEHCTKKLNESIEWKGQLTTALERSSSNMSFTALRQAVGGENGLCSMGFKRQRLQIRMFELGETYYIGMELPREYDTWKTTKFRDAIQVQKLLDRLWIEAATDVLALGDVFNPGGKVAIPQIHTIDSTSPQKLGELGAYDAFSLPSGIYHVDRHDPDKGICIRLADGGASFWVPNKTRGIAPDADPTHPGVFTNLAESTDFKIFDSFEILSIGSKSSFVRNQEGYVAEISHNVEVIRLSDLSKGPDGRTSKVAVASFPVAHVACTKTMFRRDEPEYMSVYIGDAQGSPHFMRYSGLTGACINAVSFNNFIGDCLVNSTSEKKTMNARDRYQQYFAETSWSTAEVVHRGTGEGFGEDGFLRPGFEHKYLIKFLRGRLEEQDASGLVDGILSDFWKKKLGTSLVPRGLETDSAFLMTLHSELMSAVAKEFGVQVDENEWSSYILSGFLSAVPSNSMIARLLILLGSIISHAQNLAFEKSRVSSELFKQSKPVDSIADDFAVEAQNFATGLTMSTALATFALALRLLSEPYAKIASTILGLLSIRISFGTITNVSRYRNRNEEARTLFFDKQLPQLEKDIMGQLPSADRRKHQHEGVDSNPYWKELKKLHRDFLDQAVYYDEPKFRIDEFEKAFRAVQADVPVTLETFRMRLVKEFISISFQKNSYLQETLVRMYRVVKQNILFQEAEGGKPVVRDIEKKLPNLRKTIEASLQRGPIRYGFVRKDLKWYQNPLVVGIQRCLFIPSRAAWTTGKLWKLLKERSEGEVPALRRGHSAIRQLHFATVESQNACRIILSASIVFLSGFLFSVFRFISFFRPENPATGEPEEKWVRLLVDVTAWAVVGTILGAMIAVSHFLRKLGHLLFLFWQVFHHSGNRDAKSKTDAGVILSATLWQILLTILRLLANILACVALPWSAYQSSTGTKPFSDLPRDLPLWFAAGSLGITVLAAILFLFVELFIRYNLDPMLGRAIFNLFEKEIQDIYESELEGLLQAHLVVTTAKNASRTATEMQQLISAANDTIQIDDPTIEEQAWELTARRFLSSENYRFDTVFAADRFGSIFHYLHLYGHKH